MSNVTRRLSLPPFGIFFVVLLFNMGTKKMPDTKKKISDFFLTWHFQPLRNKNQKKKE